MINSEFHKFVSSILLLQRGIFRENRFFSTYVNAFILRHDFYCNKEIGTVLIPLLSCENRNTGSISVRGVRIRPETYVLIIIIVTFGKGHTPLNVGAPLTAIHV